MSTNRFDAKRLQLEVDQSIERMKDRGFELVTEEWGDADNKCGCALTMLCFDKLGLDATQHILDDDPSDPAKDRAAALSQKLDMELSESLVLSFITGFDSMSDETHRTGEALMAQRAGLAIREKWLPFQDEEDEEDLEGDEY